MIAIRSPSDFWAGLLFIFFGSLFLYHARGMDFGSALRMGPSFFPIILSGLLVLIGIVTIVRSVIVGGEPITKFALKGMLAITAAGLLFAVLVRGAGIIFAVPALTLISAAASERFHWRTALIMAAILTIFCGVVFVYGLGVPMPVIGTWFVE